MFQTVPLPDETVLAEAKGIPSSQFPSDHLALIVDFEWFDSEKHCLTKQLLFFKNLFG